MPLPLATAWWIAPLITTALLALPCLLIWRLERRRPRGDAGGEEAGNPEGSGGPPPPLPQIGPGSWEEFERQFAEYVEQSPERPDGPGRGRR